MSDPALPIATLLAVAVAATGRRRRRARRHHSLRYTLYLRSPLWRLRRRLWILQAHGRCEHCRRWWGRQLTIHHLTYQRLGHEHRRDIQVLCWPCHRSQQQTRRPGPRSS